jgi:hypothetical protein
MIAKFNHAVDHNLTAASCVQKNSLRLLFVDYLAEHTAQFHAADVVGFGLCDLAAPAVRDHAAILSNVANVHPEHERTMGQALAAHLFRGKMLAMLMRAHRAGELKVFNTHAGLADKRTFKRFIAPLRRIKWVVYCKAPFAGPEQCCDISPVTPIGLPSQTAASLQPTARR